MYYLRPLNETEDGEYTIDVPVLGCESLSIIYIGYKRAKYPLALFKDDVEIERNR